MNNKNLFLMILGILVLISLTNVVSALSVQNVHIFPETIAPGESASIDIFLENNLDNDAEEVSVSLDLTSPTLPFAPYASSSEITVEEISQDQSQKFSFEIIALTNAESGIYKIPIAINYKVDGIVEPTKYSLISVIVNAKPVLSLEVEDGLLLEGGKNEVSIRVINQGLAYAKFLNVEIGSSTHYTILSKKSVYIGDLDSDDFNTADFELYFKSKSPSKVNVPISVTYRDSLNKEYTEEFTLQVKVYTQDQAIKLGLMKKSNTVTYVIVVVVLIVLWIIYRRLKKRRKLKKASE